MNGMGWVNELCHPEEIAGITSVFDDLFKNVKREKNEGEMERERRGVERRVSMPSISMKHHSLRPEWQKDNSVAHCLSCSVMFNLVKRRHHCRACGKIFCSTCCSSLCILTKLGYMEPQRVCKKCYALEPMPKTSISDYQISKQMPPIQRSRTVLFSPPSSPVINECGTEDEGILNKLHYFNFDLTIGSKTFKDIQVSLSKDRIFLVDSPLPFRTLYYRDILSVRRCSSATPLENTIYWFPWKGCEKETKQRIKFPIHALFYSKGEANHFHKVLSMFLHYSNSLGKDIIALRKLKKLLVLVNAMAGSGNAWKTFQSVANVFELGNIQCDTVCSFIDLDDTNAAKGVLRDGDLTPYFAIACCGGDGLMHTSIGALLEVSKDIPIFCIPAGHGVGLASSILGDASPLSAAFSIAKGFRRKLDIGIIHEGEHLLCYCCTLIAWGGIADVEFNTKNLRWMGPVRYRVGALVHMGKPPTFHFKISYLPTFDQNMSFCTGEGCERCLKGSSTNEVSPTETDAWVEEEGFYSMVMALNVSDSTYNHRFAPYAHPSDGAFDLFIAKSCSRQELIAMYTALSTGSFVDKTAFNQRLGDKFKYIKVTAFSVVPLEEGYTSSIDGIPYPHTNTFHFSILPSAVTLG